ncbi:MAG TPA: acetylxylan esterase [Gemmataceae bacterium]|nr:acetylxylan esterase [Gemmataceae bacterium]
MRLSLAVLGALAVTIPATADFPPPDKLPPRPGLPDPTVMLDGTKVTTREQWEAKCRPELKALFEHYMYGKYPARPEKVTAKVLFEDPKALGGKGTLREVELTFGPPEWPKIYLLVAVPNGKTPAGCFVGTNFGGNHLLTADERVHIPTVWVPDRYPGVVKNKASAEGRGKQADTWPLEQIIDRGYAVATFYCGDIQPDRPDVREGMRATMPESDKPTLGNETATIMWWAWGVHRAVDFLLTDRSIDPKRIAVVGHSRLGKTALLAGAFDERIAVVIPNQAGCGGTGPSRHDDPKAETVKRINTSFPHWFCGNFKAFNDDPTKLPFDQNCLVAICAPRPVLFTNAAEDLWANPRGQFEVLKAANPAYKLYGQDGLTAEKPPAPGDPLIDTRLGYWIRPGQHAMSPPDWKTYMDFADKWLK